MNKHALIVATVALVALTVGLSPKSTAHQDRIALLTKVEKVYEAPAPLGVMRVTYTAAVPAIPASEGTEARPAVKPSLKLECDLFKSSVLADELEDLPRPDWSSFVVAFSLTNYSAEKSAETGRRTWVEEPYIYITVPLHGPPGESWSQTWVQFHFDKDGQVTRRIKRNVPRPATNSIHVIREDWPVNTSAAEILQAKTPK